MGDTGTTAFLDDIVELTAGESFLMIALAENQRGKQGLISQREIIA